MPGPPKKKGAAPRLQCSTCHNTYSNISHLRRHEANHNGHRLITCPSCSKSFVRNDVARRHIRSCANEDSEINLPTAKRGKKPRACDRCSRSKVPCNLETPCSRCQSRGLACLYTRASTLTPTSTDEFATYTDLWLLRVTDPLAVGTTEAVSRDLNAVYPIGGEAMPVSMTTLEDEPFLPDSGAWMSSFYLDPSLDVGEEYLVNAEKPVYESPALSIRLKELITQLADTHRIMRSNGTVSQPDFDMRLAQSVFTGRNAEYFLGVYFQRIQPYNPIIHSPTFDCEKVSLPLLLAVFLYGALFSFPLDDAISAHSFFHVAEEFIFNHPYMKRTMGSGSGTSACIGDSLEILQAAFSITAIQNSKNDEVIRRRIRVQRYPHLVAVAKISGVLQTKRQMDLSEYTASTWDQFIREETSIRIAHWTQISNGFLVCCFNNHTQVHIAEMVGDMPCRRELFDAETAEEFARLVSLEPSGPPPQSLACSVSCLLQDSWPGPEHEIYKRVTPETVSIIIQALSTSIVVARGNGPFSMVSRPYLRACLRWKSLWDVVTKKDGKDQKTLPGYVKHAMDLWWFCMAIIKAEQSGDLTSHYMNNFALDSFASVNEFLQRYKGIKLHEALSVEKRTSNRPSSSCN